MSYPVSSSYASTPSTSMGASTSEKPPKYKGGKINPDWVKWNEAQNKANGSAAPGTTIPPQAPPVICSMQEKMELETDTRKEIAFTVQMEQTLEKIQEPNYASSVGLNSDDMVDELGKIMAKYEIPMGLAKKLIELGSFDSLEFIIDDSGSMQSPTDSRDVHGRQQTRRDEALQRVLEMIEILSYIKVPPIKFRFLNFNGRSCCLELMRRGEKPADFFQRAKAEIEKMWMKPTWTYSTPMMETLKKSFDENQGKKVVRYVFGDGVPDGGQASIREMERMFMNRKGSKENPVTFMSCTDHDSDVEWMKELEEKAPHCSECDDSDDEKTEVMGDQGKAFPYTKGFYLVCALVAAMNPDDLDCMDESVPFSKNDFDLLQGYVSTEDGYRKYFDGFLEAQQMRRASTSADRVKNSMNWRPLYNELCRQEHASNISAVQDYRKKLAAA